MDIAKAFEILSQGKIISANSSEYVELVNMLLIDSFFNELKEEKEKLQNQKNQLLLFEILRF